MDWIWFLICSANSSVISLSPWAYSVYAVCNCDCQVFNDSSSITDSLPFSSLTVGAIFSSSFCNAIFFLTSEISLSNFVSYNIDGQLNIGLTEECLVSDYRVYATALSEEDIKELYNTSAYVSDNGTLLTYSVEE